MGMKEVTIGLGGGSMLQIANRTLTQMMSYLIDTPEGGLLMMTAVIAVLRMRRIYMLSWKKEGSVWIFGSLPTPIPTILGHFYG